MPDIKTLLWYFLAILGLVILYLKRRLIFNIIKEKMAFQQQYNQLHKKAYQTEKLKQAKAQGILKARQPGLLSAGLGTNLRKLAEQENKPKKKGSKKKKEDSKTKIEKLIRL